MAEPKLIKIEQANKVIFVGDTHGDLEASQKVISEYLPARNAVLGTAGGKPKNKIVFLGDYVDRGRFSRQNLEFLLEQKNKFPEQIFLLQGNHEGHHIASFVPAEFWNSLSQEDYEKYCSIVQNFPLAVIVKDIIALHGVLPGIETLEDINQIKIGDENWFQITWGDFVDVRGDYLGASTYTGRPQFGREWFFDLMDRFEKKVLIRSHQPDAPELMFDNRCLTIFTSSAYTRERTISILDFKKEIETAKDLEIKRI